MLCQVPLEIMFILFCRKIQSTSNTWLNKGWAGLSQHYLYNVDNKYDLNVIINVNELAN